MTELLSFLLLVGVFVFVHLTLWTTGTAAQASGDSTLLLMVWIAFGAWWLVTIGVQSMLWALGRSHRAHLAKMRAMVSAGDSVHSIALHPWVNASINREVSGAAAGVDGSIPGSLSLGADGFAIWIGVHPRCVARVDWHRVRRVYADRQRHLENFIPLIRVELSGEDSSVEFTMFNARIGWVSGRKRHVTMAAKMHALSSEAKAHQVRGGW